MRRQLCRVLEQSIDALIHVPGTTLQTIEAEFRQQIAHLKKINRTLPANFDYFVEEVITYLDEMVYMKRAVMSGALPPYIDILVDIMDIPESADSISIIWVEDDGLPF